jgi:hypothetical protein
MAADRENDLLSIVVIGAFNPTIFHPSWFATHELIRQGEAEAATVEIVHREASVFTTEWLRLQVTRDRLHLQTERQSDFDALRDLAVGTLTLLSHTPTRVVGVNHDTTLRFGTREEFDDLGWLLSPKDLWDPVLERPGLAHLQEQGLRPDEYQGYLRIKVEPVLDGTNRAVVGINDHVVLSEDDSTASTEQIRRLLMDEWKSMAVRAEQMLEHVIGLTCSHGTT